MSRAKLEKTYQEISFLQRTLAETRKRLEAQKADCIKQYGEGNALAFSYDRDIAKVDELVKTIGEYLGVCDDWKVMTLLTQIMADEKSLLDERFTETHSDRFIRGVEKRIQKNWEKIAKLQKSKEIKTGK
ncbi:MAG: hypothetical protein IJX98_03290 [Clostridia bacterium]|nr:hypothetical protein [Clostridia bacterium]